jgi:hypothetical protein
VNRDRADDRYQHPPDTIVKMSFGSCKTMEENSYEDTSVR